VWGMGRGREEGERKRREVRGREGNPLVLAYTP